jgi:hypothetical protein
MADLVGRGDHGGERAALQVLPLQAHRLAKRVVMVARVGRFDDDFLQAGFVEQMARQFAGVAGKVGSLVAIAGEHAPGPKRGSENDGQQDHNTQDDKHQARSRRREPRRGFLFNKRPLI